MKNRILHLTKLLIAVSIIIPQLAFSQTVDRPALLEEPSDVWAWGFNNLGQVGVDDQANNIINPTLVTTDAIYISGGESHGFYIDGNNILWGFGKNANGQLGNGDTGGLPQYSPVQIAEDVIYVKAMRETSFYITSDGKLWAMGKNSHGQLGFDTEGENQFSPVEVTSVENVVEIDGGDNHTLFLTSDGTLYGVGNNSAGHLGVDPAVEDAISSPVVIDTDVVQVASAFITTVYLKNNGVIWSMGDNSHGQLGIGDPGTSTVFTPQFVAGNASYVNCAARQCVFIDNNSALWGFGRGNWGQLGTGDASHASAPVQFLNGNDVVHAATGQRHSIFAKSDGTVWVTGHNDQNQMAIENTVIGQVDTPEARNIGNGNVTMVSTKGAFNLVIDESPPTTSLYDDSEIPGDIKLYQNYPNPFNPTTNISYYLPVGEHVLLEVYSITGKKIMTLVDNRQSSGMHTVTMNAENLSSGIYIYRLKAGSFQQTKSLTLIK